ncbi:MAG: choice-of-anchor Q domain-containing protein [Dokdonella sp.]
MSFSCAALLFAPHGNAIQAMQTFTVNSTQDLIDDNTSDNVCHTAANTCTLRAAVMQANRSPGEGATINLPPGTYVLTRTPANADGEDTGDLNLTTPTLNDPPITIVGAGATATIIDAGHVDRVFDVGLSRTAKISGVTLRNGVAANLNAEGGGIWNQGTLTLDHIVVSGNHADYGGGIFNFGTLSMQNSIIASNVGTASGGGLYNQAFGGGAGSVTIIASTVASNTAKSGGGLINYGAVNIVNSTIAGNEAVDDGGGIYDQGSSANIYNSTIAYNDADQDRDGVGLGGGVYISGSGTHLDQIMSLLAGNTMGNTPLYDDCDGNGYLVEYGLNILGTDADSLSGCIITNAPGGDSAELNSLSFLGGLADNGGPTPTIALLSGNNAIDQGNPMSPYLCVDQGGNGLPYDQRGFARTDGACDIGAFEYGAVDRIFKNGFE